MFRASSFRLSMFEQCPQRYKFHYVDGLARMYAKPRPYFTMGDHVHAALKDFMSTVPTEERTASRLEALLREKWSRYRKGFTDLEDERQWGEKALAQLRWFAGSQDLSVTPLMLEDYHTTELTPTIALVGRIDRVDQETGGGLHIIDYKTGRMPEDLDSTQLLIYTLILSRNQDQPVTRASYLYLEAGELRSIHHTPMDLQETASSVLSAVDKILAEREYPAVVNGRCRACDFLEICPSKGEVMSLVNQDEEADF